MLCSRWQWDWVSALKWLLMLFSWTFFFTWLSIYHRMDQKEWMGVFTIPVWSIDSAVRSENRRRLAFSSMDYCTLKSITLMVVLCRHSALITNDLRPYKWRFFFPSNIILLRDTHTSGAHHIHIDLYLFCLVFEKNIIRLHCTYLISTIRRSKIRYLLVTSKSSDSILLSFITW